MYKFFILIFFVSCSIQKDNSTSLRLEEKIPSSAIRKEAYYVTTSSLAEPLYLYKENNNTFNIMINKKGLISFFKPINPSFVTPCGIKIGDSLIKVKKISKKDPKLMPGWGYFILLSNGWFAGLGNENKMLTHGKLSPNAKVIFLFKSVYHLSWYE